MSHQPYVDDVALVIDRHGTYLAPPQPFASTSPGSATQRTTNP